MSHQINYLYIFILGAALPFSTLLAQPEAPSTIFVGNGSFSGEYYSFYDDQDGTSPIVLSEYVFYRGSSYTFERISDNGHPFYLSDVPKTNGSYHYGALSIQLNTTASIGQSDGIMPTESFSFTIPDGYSNTLHYYCTIPYHSRMVAALSIADAPPSPPTVVESSGLVSLLKNSLGYYVNSASIPITNNGEQINDLYLPGWIYLGVEASRNSSYAYDLLLLNNATDQREIWNLDASGARIDGENITLQQLRSYEIAFAQDLDGDGQIEIALDPTRLIITEVDPGNNYAEVTNFGSKSGVLEQTTVITSILGDTVTLPYGTAFSSGETKDEEFTNSFLSVEHLQLIALDAKNKDFWVPAADNSGKGHFYDQQAIDDPVPHVAQGSIAIGLQTVVSNLSHLIGMVDPDDDTGRLFIYEQTGTVQVLNQNGSIEPNPLMDVTSQLVPLTGLFGEDAIGYDERGLLGVALSPEFSTNGTLYYYASLPIGGTPDFTFDSGVVIDHHSVVIERTFTDSNLNSYFDSNDTFTERELLRFEQPLAEFFPLIGSNHNGGHLAFDTSGYLMVSIGDGGDRDDTGNGHGTIGNGADPSNIWGTIIRIDPNGSNSVNGQYGIPVDNPFLGDATKLAEIFAYGLRNPWTFSQDPVTGIIYTSDSGQDPIQEVNVVTPGGNYGWRAKEGSFLFDPISGTIGSLFNAPSISGHIDPIVEYDHDQDYANVIGGSVYRGSLLPELNGFYICGDYGPIFGTAPGELFYVDTNGPDAQLKRFQIGVTDRALSSDVRGFSVDAQGEIYFVGNSNGQSSLYKIVPLAHLSIELTDHVEVTVIGDEGSQLSLQQSSDISTINSGTSIELTGSKSVIEYTLEEVGEQLFFKATAE